MDALTTLLYENSKSDDLPNRYFPNENDVIHRTTSNQLQIGTTETQIQ